MSESENSDIFSRQISTGSWKVVNRRVAQHKFYLTMFQMFIIFTVIISCIICLLISKGNTEVWISFFGLAFGAILPSPKVKKLVVHPMIESTTNRNTRVPDVERQ